MSTAAPSMLKRLLVGRAFTSHQLEHTLLPKVLALPVFASDALSSVAYATGEIFIQLTIVSLAFKSLVMPISIAIAALMGIVVISYRQTVRAYPSGGGAYIVSKDNLGAPAGLVAAAALLVDYMMTVVVSIVAGVFAIGSAFPAANEHAVVLSIFFVWFVTIANLRGARESGTLFAVPTYGFVVSILLMVVIGFVQCLGGCPATEPVEPIHNAATTAGAIGLFAVLRAFSSGATALTGVEAISNGVPAFRRPQARNAAETLAIMGVIAITMFLGISWLSVHVHGTVASDVRSIPAQIAWAVFGGGGIGFYVVQFFTAAILILAANTAYQDFPRLSSILARDRYMPSQFMNRGDRLVFSNGIVVLAIASSLMIYAFDADLTRLIQLYVIGVFTSFTLSQSGMVVHWLRERHKGDAAARGWRRSIVINVIGATATAVVLLVVMVTKFTAGGWLSMLFMAILFVLFVSIHRHYVAVSARLRRGIVRPGEAGVNHAVLVIRQLDAAAAEALGTIRSIRPTELHIVHPTSDGISPELQQQWLEFSMGGPPLEPLELGKDSPLDALRRYVRGIERAPEDFVNVVIPETVPGSLLLYLLRRAALVRLKAGLLRERNIVVTDVPVVIRDGKPVGVDARSLIPERTVALVFVSAVHDATIRAVNYAQTLEASETRAIYFDLDPEAAHRMQEQWGESGMRVPLHIVEAPFRDLTRPMLEEVRRFTRRPGTLVLVVIPEFIVSKWRHLLLHNQNALFVKRLFLFEPNVVLSSVPFVLGEREREGSVAR
ncbi:MAG TPA: APC family permease [Actinomycetota bacterium]|nr:APC family permease [Actinomycetota bacterium]